MESSSIARYVYIHYPFWLFLFPRHGGMGRIGVLGIVFKFLLKEKKRLPQMEDIRGFFSTFHLFFCASWYLIISVFFI